MGRPADSRAGWCHLENTQQKEEGNGRTPPYSVPPAPSVGRAAVSSQLAVEKYLQCGVTQQGRQVGTDRKFTLPLYSPSGVSEMLK